MKMTRNGAMRGEGRRLPQQPAVSWGAWPGLGLARRRGRHRRSRHRALAQGHAAMGTEEFIEFTRGQHQQEPFAHLLRATALGAVEFARGKSAKLLRHLTSRLCAST